MRRACFFLLFLAAVQLYGGHLFAAEPRLVADSNTAFYDGESFRYVIPAPRLLKLITEKAALDGYSFAFIPKNEDYDSASMVLGVNIYKIRGIRCDSVICRDTSLLREHYGDDIDIRKVDSVFAGSGEMMATFYVDSKKRFLPNVMFSYFDGSSELLIFELVIAPSIFRLKAEELFMTCLRNFKALRRGTLGVR